MAKQVVQYSDEFANAVIDYVANGGTINQFCNLYGARDTTPDRSTIYKWSNPNCPEEYRPEFAARMALAEEQRTHGFVDELIDWSQPAHISSTIDGEKGLMPNSAEIQKYDTCSKNRQWLLARLKPAQFSINPHKHIKLQGETAQEKLVQLLRLVESGDLSTQAGLNFAQLIKSEAELGELKSLMDKVDELKQMLAAVGSSTHNQSTGRRDDASESTVDEATTGIRTLL